MIKRILIIGLVFLLVFSSVVPISIGHDVKIPDNIEQSSNRGNTFYVGGSGPNNYTRIQDAIDKASDGDTVYVYNDSSPYYENLLIIKSINLIGEDKNTTVIDGNNEGNVVEIYGQVTISGFTIQHCDFISIHAGIMIYSSYNIISDNIITQNDGLGIMSDFNYIQKYNHNLIFNNIITENGGDAGVALFGSFNNISYNRISNNRNTGIYLSYGYNNIIYQNIINNNIEGILLSATANDQVSRNIISNNSRGIELDSTSNTKILQNNFIGNKENAHFILTVGVMIRNIIFRQGKSIQKNIWNENFWEISLEKPYIITGLIVLTQFSMILHSKFYNYFQIDFHPAKEPYDI